VNVVNISAIRKIKLDLSRGDWRPSVFIHGISCSKTISTKDR
jgi:hypothetical protein